MGNEFNRVETDESGNEYLVDENGQPIYDEQGNRIPPTKTSKSYRSSGFLVFDTSQGHCGLCGKLTCNGNCFK